jgi:hypothetical protein
MLLFFIVHRQPVLAYSEAFQDFFGKNKKSFFFNRWSSSKIFFPKKKPKNFFGKQPLKGLKVSQHKADSALGEVEEFT